MYHSGTMWMRFVVARLFVALSTLLIATAAIAASGGSASDPIAHPIAQWSLLLGGGRSGTNWHGRASFRTIELERTFREVHLRWLIPSGVAGFAISYSEVRQPHSWFGHRDGDPDDRVRAEKAVVFVRRSWSTRSPNVGLFADVGSGPMWSNRRIPAATLRLNFSSQLGLGVVFGANSRTPFRLGYRFSHVSNGGTAERNPGLNVHGIFIGVRVPSFSRLR